MLTNDDSFSIKLLGRAGLEYSENGFVILVDGEMLMGPSGYVVYKNYMKVLEGNVELDEILKNKIIENIRMVFAEQGFNIEIQ